MTWVSLGIAGASQQVVGPEDASEFRVVHCPFLILGRFLQYIFSLFFSKDVVLIAIGIGAFFSLLFHLGVDEVKENHAYQSAANQSKGPAVMKAIDWLKEKQFYQV